MLRAVASRLLQGETTGGLVGLFTGLGTVSGATFAYNDPHVLYTFAVPLGGLVGATIGLAMPYSIGVVGVVGLAFAADGRRQN
jgi:hypothetical protein